MSQDAFVAAVNRAKSEKYKDMNEATVKDAIVLPLLEAIGWNRHDDIHHELETGAGIRVDILINDQIEQNRVMIEIKSAKHKNLIGQRTLLLERARRAAIRFAVITNGLSWLFVRLDSANRAGVTVTALNLSADNRLEFERLLGKQNIITEMAHKYWQADLRYQDDKIEYILRAIHGGPQFFNLVLREYKAQGMPVDDESIVREVLNYKLKYNSSRYIEDHESEKYRLFQLRDEIVDQIKNTVDGMDIGKGTIRGSSHGQITYHIRNQNVELGVHVHVFNNPYKITYQVALIKSGHGDLLSKLQGMLPILSHDLDVNFVIKENDPKNTARYIFEWTVDVKAGLNDPLIIDSAKRFRKAGKLIKETFNS